MHIAILQENVFLEEKLILLVTKKFIPRISKGYKAKKHPHFFLRTVAMPWKHLVPFLINKVLENV